MWDQICPDLQGKLRTRALPCYNVVLHIISSVIFALRSCCLKKHRLGTHHPCSFVRPSMHARYRQFNVCACVCMCVCPSMHARWAVQRTLHIEPCRQTNFVEVVRVSVEDVAAFERKLEASVLDLSPQGATEETGVHQHKGSKASTGAQTPDKSKKSGDKEGKAGGKQQSRVQKDQDRPKLLWLSESEMLAACKGGRGNKAGGGAGAVGLSTGPRKIFALAMKEAL